MFEGAGRQKGRRCKGTNTLQYYNLPFIKQHLFRLVAILVYIEKWEVIILIPFNLIFDVVRTKQSRQNLKRYVL